MLYYLLKREFFDVFQHFCRGLFAYINYFLYLCITF